MSNKTKAMAACCLLAGFTLATAQADTIVNPSTEYLKRIKVAETIEPLGETPFGESLSLYTGTVSFRQTDISFPGIGPTITLMRTYEASGSGTADAPIEPLGDWDLSIPRITTLVPGSMMGTTGNWRIGGATPDARCSQIDQIANPFEYGLAWWHGYQMITPDGASQPLLHRGPQNTLAPNNDTARYPIVTQSHWMISCLPTTSNGQPGEAFLALAPDGTKYWFDHLVYGAGEGMLIEERPEQGPSGYPLLTTSDTGASAAVDDTNDIYWGVHILKMPRKRANMYASRVEDRFGNWLTYKYDTLGRLIEINASDLRKVSLVWNNALLTSITVQPASATARTWRYEYVDGLLARVVQPDLSGWRFAMGGAGSYKLLPLLGNGVCGIRYGGQATGVQATMVLTHPSGLIGQFEVGQRVQGRADVPTGCTVSEDGSPQSEAIPPLYASFSLVRKTLSGPGIATSTWTYNYSEAYASTATDCAAGAQCRDWKWVEMTDPLNQTTHYRFSTRWGYTDGKLLNTVSGVTQPGQDNPVGMQNNYSGYASPTQGPYPASLGVLMSDSMAGSNDATSETLSPENLQHTVRQGVTFTRQTNAFDTFGNAIHVSRYSSLGSGVTEVTGYLPVTSQWVLGQVQWLLDVDSWKEIARTDYDAKLLPMRTYSFGLLVGTYNYNTNGTLARITDPRGNATTLSQYFRGIPQHILFADSTVLAPAADEFGQIASVKNQLGTFTNYLYDPLGRMTRMDFPTTDTANWNPAIRSFLPVAGNEYGLSAGHWKQVVQTGNGRATTYYDAFWRPRVVMSEDAANVASRSFVVHRYDALGREVFTSYPVATLGTVNDALSGMHTSFDALGRVVRAQQDSELGLLSTSTEYLDGFRTRVTNPRQFATTTSYQVFDAPSDKSPTRIEAPEGVTTVIVRDHFGKPKTITRSGPAG